MDLMNKSIWLVGTGLMGIEYAKVLKALNCNFIAIGRGSEKCKEFENKTGVKPYEGGIDHFLSSTPPIPDYVFIAVGIESLSATAIKVIKYGVKSILLEKPGVGYINEIYDLYDLSQKYNSSVFVAYNRRFYASVKKAKEIIVQDGGVSSVHFEFTEWAHIIKELPKHKSEHENWFLGNSTHVIDTAFFLAGNPMELSSFVKGSLDWHPSSSIFTGAGITEQGALFSYHANWESPGRWAIEVLTPKHRLIFKPMETLQIQSIGSILIESVEINDVLDKEFKPGVYKQVEAFLNNDHDDMINIEMQKNLIEKFYLKMSGYKL